MNTSEWRKEVRQAAREFITGALSGGDRFETWQLDDGFQVVEPSLADDLIACNCQGRRADEPEWKHQLRFAELDLKGKVIKRADPRGWELITVG